MAPEEDTPLWKRLFPKNPLIAGLIAETPLLAGFVAGAMLLRVRGDLFMPTRVPAGFDWAEYLPAAWMAVHRVDLGFPGFRNPLYPWLLGTLGERLGDYAYAAVVLSSLGVLAIVLAAGLGARALAGAWAGGLAAFSVPWVYGAAHAARWVSLYPVAGGLTGLTLAFAACSSRWPRWYWALPAGICGGLAWGIDDRSLVAVAGALILVISGAIQQWSGLERRGRARAFLLLALFLLVLPIGPVSKHLLAVAPQAPTRNQLAFQRENALRGIRDSNIPALQQACAGEKPYALPSIPGLRRPCARALLRYNLTTYPPQLPFGLRWTLIALPFVLLPGRRGWSAVVASLAVFAPAVAAVGVMSLWVMVPDRYLLHFGTPLAMIVPVALERLVRTVASLKLAPWLVAAVMLSATWWGFYRAPHGRPPPPVDQSEQSRAMSAMLERIRTDFRAGDVLLDCTAMGLETALLPRRFHSPPLNLYGRDLSRCLGWLDAPEDSRGQRWLVTTVRCPFAPPPPGSPEARVVESCYVCEPVPNPSGDARCPHDLPVMSCPICANRTIPTDRWEKVTTEYSGYSCLDTLVLWRWKESR